MKRFRSLIYPTLVVLVLVGAFALGTHQRNVVANAAASRQALRPENGWAREAQSGDQIQTTKGGKVLPALADDEGGDFGFPDGLGSDSPVATFQQVYELLKEQYVEGVPSDTPLAYGAAQAMLSSLDDPNSRFLEPTEHAAFELQDQGTYPGSGLAFTVRHVTVNGIDERQITVIDALSGSPADKAGLRTGDVITTIDGHWVISFDPFAADMKHFKSLEHDEVGLEKAYNATEDRIKDGVTLPKAQTELDTTQTDPLVLVVQRAGEPKPFTVTLDCSTPTQVTSVESKTLDGGQGYIHINTLDSTTLPLFDAALGSLAGTKGLVIDLRHCAGGQLSPAIAIAHALNGTADFGRIQLRDNHSDKVDPVLGFKVKVQVLHPGDEGSATLKNSYHDNIVVLVDSGTANTAEMLAAFLHDSLGARIAGTTTFGDGMAQTLFPLSDGSAFTLTTGALQTDLGKPFAMTGIAPDVEIADVDSKPASDDAAVAKAETLLTMPPLKIEVKSDSAPQASSEPTISL